jgi:RecB family exonuclease
LRAAEAEILTRDQLYVRLHERSKGLPPLLSEFEREVLLSRAAHAAAVDVPVPFRLRPGLIVEMLGFYDALRRRDRTVADFDRLISASLEPSVEIDRGAERLFAQTRFLSATLARFESLVAATSRLDEHSLRDALMDSSSDASYARIVVTTADQAADPRGLWTADYDLLARIPHLESLDVVATENVLAAGFHERIHDVLPGIVEERRGRTEAPPVLLTPPHEGTGEPRRWFVSRDREEELVDFVRRIDPGSGMRSAVVFQRPLPYLYLAQSVFADAGQPYQALDSLPLAAEPFAAALDVVFGFLSASANRASLIDLLSSPHWQFEALSGPVVERREQVNALDTHLREMKYLGGWERLEQLAAHSDETPGKRRRKRVAIGEALRAGQEAAQALAPVRTSASAAGQLRALVEFILSHERRPDVEATWAVRHERARSAVLGALEALSRAQATHDDGPLPIDRLIGAVRRWIDAQTFSPRTGSSGALLLDTPAAAYADVDEVWLVGLVESDWPERGRNNIFYPSNLLAQLGWPKDADRVSGARARFNDLLLLPRRRVALSTFTLEDDAIVAGSVFLQELDGSGLTIEREPEGVGSRMALGHEGLFDEPPRGSSENEGVSRWLGLRVSRSPATGAEFHGAAGPQAPGIYAVSHVERYLDCPFKYFAGRVLGLEEEREDESGLTPQERGQLLHEVFERFFGHWHERGRGAVSADNLDDALELFAEVAEATLARLPEADRALERTYLLGSAVAPGLGERAFNFEIEQDVPVLERLLEHEFDGEFTFKGADGPRVARIRGKADRVDLLEDGTLRIIDYKLGRAPKTSRALQLPVYGACAEQQLRGHRGREWTVSNAGYVAFKEKNPFVALASAGAMRAALDDGAARFVAAIEGIERGEFPVTPDEPYRCRWCGYASVCRKDYVGDE